MCHFCEKPRYFQKNYLKRKVWFEKKGKPSVFVCFESNLIVIPYNTWWIDLRCSIHVFNMMQGFLSIQTTNINEKFVYMGNKVRVLVEAIRTYRLISRCSISFGLVSNSLCTLSFSKLSFFIQT